MNMKSVAVRTLILLATAWTAGCANPFDDCIDGSGDLQTETRQVSSFHSVVVKGSADVTFVQGNEQNLSITADDNILPIITTTVSGERLTIDAKECYSPSETVKITMTIPDLRTYRIEGSGSLTNLPSTSSEQLVLNDLLLEVEGSGEIDLHDLMMEDMTIRIEGSGEIDITGEGESIDVEIEGSGEVIADRFPVRNAEGKIEGSGEIRLYATEVLRASISGSGTIYYRGTPATLETEIDGSGKIIKLD